MEKAQKSRPKVAACEEWYIRSVNQRAKMPCVSVGDYQIALCGFTIYQHVMVHQIGPEHADKWNNLYAVLHQYCLTTLPNQRFRLFFPPHTYSHIDIEERAELIYLKLCRAD